jgi:hypothetical protein
VSVRTGAKPFWAFDKGATENATVVGELLGDLMQRGLGFSEPRLYVLDGGKALHTAVRKYAGESAPIQRCQVHKRRNVLDHLTDEQKPGVARKLNAAYALEEYAAARQAVDGLHHELMHLNPSAARSLAEGLEETLTAHRLHVPQQLRLTLASTNVIESAFSIVEKVCLNVKRWHSGDQRERWVGSGLLVAQKQFRRIKGHKQILLSSQSCKLSSLISQLLRNAERHRKLSYPRAATFNGKSGVPLCRAPHMLRHVNYSCVRTDGFSSNPLALALVHFCSLRALFQSFCDPIECGLFNLSSLSPQNRNLIQIS